jgi:hypothetical protein
MAVKKVAAGDWVGDEFRHQPFGPTDTLADPNGNPIPTGGTVVPPLLMYEDTLTLDEENPAPWFLNPQAAE